MKKVMLILLVCILTISGCSGNPFPPPDERINDSGIKNQGAESAITENPSATPNTKNEETGAIEGHNPILSGHQTGENRKDPQQEAIQETNGPGTDTGTTEGIKAQKQIEAHTKTPYYAENDINSDAAALNGSDSLLSGKIICIDPGHGNPQIKGTQEKIAPNSEETKPGIVFGATGIATKTPEYKINMSVSLILKSLLEEQGCKVILTRPSDDENLGNIARAEIGNDAKSDLVIRIHADSSTDEKVRGVSVLYPDSKTISDESILAKSKSAAQYVHDAIIKATDAKPRGIVKRHDLAGFNWSTRPTLLVEMGFLSNKEEDVRLNDPDYQDKIAKGILNGVLAYFKANQP